MFVRVQNLLNDEQLTAIDKILATGTFVDGPNAASRVKNNLRLDKEKTDKAKDLDTIVTGALWVNPAIKSLVLPARIAPPLYNKHETGMADGAHSDDPVVGTGPTVRTDISVSIFLSDPDTYEGGELVVKSDVGDTPFKLARGEALLYPSGTLHAIMEVKKGERLVADTWIQSMVADTHKRRLLFELDRATASINQKMPNSEEARLLLKTYGDLVRLWAEG